MRSPSGGFGCLPKAVRCRPDCSNARSWCRWLPRVGRTRTSVEMGLDRRQVALWRQRFLAGGIDALRKDAPRSGQRASRTNYIHPEPFIWTASASDILAEVTRAEAALAATAGQVQNRVAHCTSLRIRQARCEGSHTRLGGPAGRASASACSTRRTLRRQCPVPRGTGGPLARIDFRPGANHRPGRGPLRQHADGVDAQGHRGAA